MLSPTQPRVSLPSALPRGLLLGAALLVALALVLVTGARLSGYAPARPTPVPAVAVVDLQFEDRADGGVVIYRDGESQPDDVLAPGTNGFVRGVLRGLARERRAENISSRAAFRLTRWADGRLSLDDPATGRHVDLEVFGPTNAGAFAAIYTHATRDRATP